MGYTIDVTFLSLFGWQKASLQLSEDEAFMLEKTVLEPMTKLDSYGYQANTQVSSPRMSELIVGFLRHGQFDLTWSSNTIKKYEECLRYVIRDIGDLQIHEIRLVHLTELKQKIIMRGAGESRVGSMVFAMKSLLRYCKEILELDVLDYAKIKPPKRHRREVLFLTNEEIQRFVDVIKIKNTWEGKSRKNCVRMDGLKFRALVEVLLGSGMRISEALSLNRDSINFETKDAKIIGKGSKERTVFFNDRSLEWVRYLLEERKDENTPLFISQHGTRWDKGEVHKLFQRYSKKVEITKKLTPHILRHTMATNLLFNGCPISHVKEILGHDRLETTCRYYLGLDKSKAKEAHGKFLNY
jgi:site-specific recombinase XerD